MGKQGIFITQQRAAGTHPPESQINPRVAPRKTRLPTKKNNIANIANQLCLVPVLISTLGKKFLNYFRSLIQFIFEVSDKETHT